MIKVVTGIRRSGKSTLFCLFMDKLKENGVGDDQIVFYNFEDFSLKNFLKDPAGLHEQIVAKASDG
ncbi:MAG: AAA family ATPase, partial [Chitinispirillales bacterium]|nr:AAA family ATPase [Chitinispirillales bacterium]